MKTHNFIEQTKEKYKRVIFCTRCGQVCWNYNVDFPMNREIQKNIRECVESGDELSNLSIEPTYTQSLEISSDFYQTMIDYMKKGDYKYVAERLISLFPTPTLSK